MEVQTSLSCRYPAAAPVAAAPVLFYASYNTPPYITPPYQQSSWFSDSSTEDAIAHKHLPYAMQHIRFPTPPITPPRNVVNDATTAAATLINTTLAQRTQSVIMQVSHGQQGSAASPQHIHADLLALDEQNHLTAKSFDSSSRSHSSSSGSGSGDDIAASPCYDNVCNWHDCGRCFENLELLAQHVTQLHAIASPLDGLYYCRWHGCLRSDRGFNARYKMLVHVRTHTKEKPHQCHLCEKSFSRAENLKIHIRSHSGEKPYKCTFEGCQKAYSNSSDRFKHTRTHSMEKPYMCKVPGCQKRYTDPSSLRKHVKTFKHETQIVHNQSNRSRSNDSNLNSTANENAAYQNYMLDSAVAEVCNPLSINETTHTTQYYMEINSTPTSYWLPEHIDIMDYDAPLDLRVHRS